MKKPPVRKVDVAPPDSKWAKEFEKEAAILQEHFPLEIIRIHHFGSTSIPGIPAKPVIDILIEVRDIAKIDDKTHVMEKLGYFENVS